MFKDYLLMLLLGHVIGDFYMQTAKIAEKKEKSFLWVLWHCLLYGIAILIVGLPVVSLDIVILVSMATISHAVIDIVKYLLVRKKKKVSKHVFFVDQILHLICVTILSYVWTIYQIPLREMPVVSEWFQIVGVSEVLVGKWILGLLIINKPANICIQHLIGHYKPKSKDNQFKADNNAGRAIGAVERIVMFILLYLNQFSAIGLVLTAKSIARYDRISKDEQFAEYYLLGTLLSAGIVIACAMVLF